MDSLIERNVYEVRYLKSNEDMTLLIIGKKIYLI